MKTLKIALIAVLLSASTVGFATDDKKSRNSAREAQAAPAKALQLTLGEAILNPFLVQQMELQVEKQNVLQNPAALFIVAHVFYSDRHYYITGSFEEWKRFFRNDGSSIRIKRSTLE